MIPQTEQNASVPSPSKAPATAEPKNLLDMLLLRAREPTKAAARFKVGGQWRDASWGEVTERVRRLSAGLVESGIKPGDRVCIFAATRYEWALANFAIFGAGAIAVPIYASNTAAEAEYIIQNSGSRAIFIDSDQPEGRLSGRLSRVASARARLPGLEQVFAFDVASNPSQQLMSLSDLEARGEAAVRANPRALEERAAATDAEDLSYIIYTSGTTGAPKGVMLTHHNWTAQAVVIPELGLLTARDVVLLFLPLAHSFALVVIAAWLGQGFLLAFAESIEKAVDNAAEVKATVLPAVPRVFEKAFNKVVNDGSAQPGVKGKLFGWAMGLFDEYAEARIAGRDYNSVQWMLAKRLVFSKIEQKLKVRFGGHMREFISGGAPLSRKIAYFFDLCGLLICEGYGLSETSAPTHANRPGMIKIGTVGQAFPGVSVRIAEDGEILVKGPQIMKGYFNMPEETASVLEPDGWFHTGDIGEEDADGCLRITDRKKDLIKTSGGKYVAPQELENALKTEPLVSQVLIHGDRRKFVSALITISEEAARKLADDHGIKVSNFAELTQRPEVRARIQAAVDAVNATQPSYASIKKFAILDHDWSQETGEITPTLKVKRKFVSAKYKELLDRFYGEESFD